MFYGTTCQWLINILLCQVLVCAVATGCCNPDLSDTEEKKWKKTKTKKLYKSKFPSSSEADRLASTSVSRN